MPAKQSEANKIREVAKLAEVSLATVYRVVSGTAHVSKETERRVREAAQQVGVVLNRKNKPKVLAFLLSNREMLHPFHSRILVGAEAACTAHGWDMLFQLFRYQPSIPWKELHLPRILQRRDMVGAVVLAGTNSPNLLDLLQNREIPFAVLGNNILDDGKQRQLDAVFSDDVQGAYEMTRYLHSLQHQDIWFVGNTAEPWSQRCYLGYERAMREIGLAARLRSLKSNDALEVGYLGTKSLLTRGEAVTAVVGATDETAQGIYKAIKERGLQIPQNISVVGCNDTLGSLLDPALTTIREFPEQLGRQMVELVLNRIENPELGAQQVTIPVELIKRHSCDKCSCEGSPETAENIDWSSMR